MVVVIAERWAGLLALPWVLALASGAVGGKGRSAGGWVDGLGQARLVFQSRAASVNRIAHAHGPPVHFSICPSIPRTFLTIVCCASGRGAKGQAAANSFRSLQTAARCAIKPRLAKTGLADRSKSQNPARWVARGAGRVRSSLWPRPVVGRPRCCCWPAPCAR